VAVGAKLLYVFDVLAVHIQVKGSSKIGRPEDTFDLFARNDFSFSRSYPCELFPKEVTVIKVCISLCLLFKLFINNIHKMINKHCSFIA